MGFMIVTHFYGRPVYIGERAFFLRLSHILVVAHPIIANPSIKPRYSTPAPPEIVSDILPVDPYLGGAPNRDFRSSEYS